MALLADVYCTEAEVIRFFSANGVTDHADHDDDGTADVGVVDDCINQAKVELDLFLLERYDETTLVASNLVNRWSVVVATRFLCQRRGNVVPDSIEREWTRLTDPRDGLLVRISEGQINLPGSALRADLRPSFSNLTIDQRHRRNTVRVTPTNSTDAPTALEQHTIQEVPRVIE